MSVNLDVCEVFDKSVDHDSYLAESGFKLHELIEILCKHNANFREIFDGQTKICKVSAYDIGAGRSHMSTVYKVVLEFVGSKLTPFTFVIKVPTPKHQLEVVDRCYKGDAWKEETDRMKRVVALEHNAECDFYAQLGPRRWIPTANVWHCVKLSVDWDRPGAIFMEDLTETGAVQAHGQTVNVHQIRHVARMVAQFHAHQLTTKFAEIRNEHGNFHISGAGDAVFQKYWTMLEQLNPAAFGPLTEKLHPLCTPSFAQFVLIDRPKGLGLPTMLCHGDLKVGNMLFKRRHDGTPGSEVLAVLDWQATFYGSPMFDLARFIAMGADAEVRREAEQFIFHLYREDLCNALRDMNGDEALLNPFTVDALTEAYNLALIQQAIEVSIYAAMKDEELNNREERSRIVAAKNAKYTLKIRLLMEDAVRRMERLRTELARFLH